jgi:DNA-binding protein Fis
MKEQQIEEQLWSYIDGSASAAEKVFVEKMLAAHEEWKAKYKEQLELHQLLINETELEQPPLRFTKNVMEQVAGVQPKAATSTYINKNIIRSIAAFFIITISALLIYSFTQINWAATMDSSKLLPFDSRGLQLPEFEITKLFNSTVLYSLLMVTVVLGLMLFDGFLRRKKSAA